MLKKLIDWDVDTFVYLNSLGSESYDSFWSAITTITTWIPLFIIFFIFISLNNTKRETFFKTLTVILLILFITTVTGLTKEFFQRLRPNNNEAINTFIRIVKNPGSYSFFSGHSSSSFSITTLIVLFLRKQVKWCWVFYLWPLLFAYSRIYVGVHYPLDILVGTLVGISSGILFYKIYGKLIAPYTKLNRHV